MQLQTVGHLRAGRRVRSRAGLQLWLGLMMGKSWDGNGRTCRQ